MPDDEQEFKNVFVVPGDEGESFREVHTEFKDGWKYLISGEDQEWDDEDRPPECPDVTQQNCWSQFPQSLCSTLCTESVCATYMPVGCPATIYRGCSPGSGQCWYGRTGVSCTQVGVMGLYDCNCSYAYAGNNCS